MRGPFGVTFQNGKVIFDVTPEGSGYSLLFSNIFGPVKSTIFRETPTIYKTAKLRLEMKVKLGLLFSPWVDVEWSDCTGTLILTAMARWTTMNGSQWWLRSEHHLLLPQKLCKKRQKMREKYSRIRLNHIASLFHHWKILFSYKISFAKLYSLDPGDCSFSDAKQNFHCQILKERHLLGL